MIHGSSAANERDQPDKVPAIIMTLGMATIARRSDLNPNRPILLSDTVNANVHTPLQIRQTFLPLS
jgi:hypothetical protein